MPKSAEPDFSGRVASIRDSTTQRKLFDQREVLRVLGAFQVRQQFSALVYHSEKTTVGVVVFFVGCKVTGKVLNPLRQKRDLDFRGAAVGLIALKFFDNLSRGYIRV